jgi:hypothetical protein
MLLSEVNGITTQFTFMSQRGRAEESALVDSGTTENFLDHSMVK